MRKKPKHNKKRNTAFLFEILTRELTKSIFNEDAKRKNKIIAIIKEHFKKGSLLNKDLESYRSICETQNFKENLAEKLLQEVKAANRMLDPQGLFRAQSRLIDDMNKNLSKSAFSTFVPNYKSLATLAQIFDDETPTKSRVLLEDAVVRQMTFDKEDQKDSNLLSIDNLTYQTFIEKFNTKYGQELREEQNNLLINYIASFSDNGIQLKLFLNEEVSRLRREIKKSLNMDEIKNDQDMVIKTNKTLKLIEGFKEAPIDESLISKILKVQNLVKEIQN